MTAPSPTVETTETPFKLSVEEFSLYSREAGQSIYFQRDHDLTANCKEASRGGQYAGLVLVELGIDGYASSGVRLDFNPVEDEEAAVRYALLGEEVRALTDAIDALTAVRDQLARVQA